MRQAHADVGLNRNAALVRGWRYSRPVRTEFMRLPLFIAVHDGLLENSNVGNGAYPPLPEIKYWIRDKLAGAMVRDV
mgnify:CR=1 FL=1